LDPSIYFYIAGTDPWLVWELIHSQWRMVS